MNQEPRTQNLELRTFGLSVDRFVNPSVRQIFTTSCPEFRERAL